MLKRQIMLALTGAALIATPALSQTTTSPSSSSPPKATAPAPAAPIAQHKAGEWRASKLIGVNVYNSANEKIGDINELILDSSGKVANVIIGVGGFLGMGEHDVAVSMDKLKFVNEPVRSTTAANDKDARPATTTTGAATRANDTRRNEWYPDHAMLDATKDQLKAMSQFKY